MLIVKSVTAKNFLSIGAQTQAVNFDDAHLTLVLGHNADLGGTGARNGVGKAQPLYSKIKTPSGWTTMGDITVGDRVSTPDGGTAVVSGVFPQGKRPTYRLTFSDGRTTDACEDHLWRVFSHAFRNSEYRILSTKDLIEHINKYKAYKNKSSSYLYVPLIVDQQPDIKLPMDPYSLGLLLGDGCFSKNGFGFSSNDRELVDYLNANLIENIRVEQKPYHAPCDYSIKCIKQTNPSPFRTFLKNMGLFNTLSHTKFIPDIYKNSGTQQKLDLIAGLVDTDGYVGKNGSVSITTVSEKMARDIQEIVWSIGGRARLYSRKRSYTYKGTRTEGRVAYTVAIQYALPQCLSKLERKRSRLPGDDYQYKNTGLRITDIEYIGEIESQCIMVDHPDHLYITDNYIVTHNTTIINALSYALYGEALTNIKRDNLINLTNGKNMMTTVDFEINGRQYRIERGRKPNILRFMVDSVEVHHDDAQGDSRETQKEINKIIGFPHEMFKHIIALNTYTEPFLSMKANDQRALIEQLLGITELSAKAELLKELIKNTKDSIREEELNINAIKNSNERISKNIADIERRAQQWQASHDQKLNDMQTALVELNEINIEYEIECHKKNAVILDNQSKVSVLVKERKRLVTSKDRAQSRLDSHLVDLDNARNGVCPSCGQGTAHLDTHEEYIKGLEEKVKQEQSYVDSIDNQINEIDSILSEYPTEETIETFYESLEKALEHKHNLDVIAAQYLEKCDEINPYTDQARNLSETGLQEINFEKINDLTALREHQEFLFKLLTSKDSFIRKKIIDQNIAYLNHRLSHYLEKIGLPHTVKFSNDLNVDITEYGRALDFDNLSRGERNRLILSLSWAFRDIYESLNQPMNLMCIDELIDSGLDTAGVENALSILKKMSRDANKNIFLVSHREELIGRVNNVLTVVKSGGFTEYSTSTEYVG